RTKNVPPGPRGPLAAARSAQAVASRQLSALPGQLQSRKRPRPARAVPSRVACYHPGPALRTKSMTASLPATEITALLGRGTRFEGKLHFTGRVRIDGGFRGDIQSEDVLIIGEGAEVEGEIDVATVIIKGGSVSANIRAKSSIELY